MSEKWVFATGNQGKLREFQQMAEPINVEVVSQKSLGIEGAEETGRTFVENAILKARDAARRANMPALADDSGLVVPALGGAPGLRSARYAGEGASDEQNLTKLLGALRDRVGSEREAFFVCVLALMRSATDPLPLIVQGRWHGVVLDAPVGTNGFGYDPIFFVPSEGRTAAELSAHRKAQLSHRGRAFRSLIKCVS